MPSCTNVLTRSEIVPGPHVNRFTGTPTHPLSSLSLISIHLLAASQQGSHQHSFSRQISSLHNLSAPVRLSQQGGWRLSVSVCVCFYNLPLIPSQSSSSLYRRKKGRRRMNNRNERWMKNSFCPPDYNCCSQHW